MTCKDYVAIAEILSAELSIATNDGEYRRVTNIAYFLADVMIRDNPRFNRDVFYKAVGIKNYLPC